MSRTAVYCSIQHRWVFIPRKRG